MKEKKTYKNQQKEESKVNESSGTYNRTHHIQIFKSFEEQARYELQEMAKLSSEQILQQLRKAINIAYGMHGYDPDNLPQKHFVKIISK